MFRSYAGRIGIGLAVALTALALVPTGGAAAAATASSTTTATASSTATQAARSTTTLGANSSATPAVTSRQGQSHCVTVIDRARSTEEFSRILSRKCATTKQAAKAAAEADAGVAASVIIFTLIEHANYGGAYDHVSVGARCDAAGYRINPGWYEWRLSSFLVDGGCTQTVLTNHSGVSKRYYGDTPYLGSAHNDNVSVIRTHA